MRSTRNTRYPFNLLLIGLSPWLAVFAFAQADTQPAITLKVGDKAPPLTIEKWIKGAPVTAFEPGKVYVVEFWATWCGPCIASMPHLSALQKAYKDKGVTFIGTNVSEEKEYTDETPKKVEDFVRQQGERMSYTVAYDGKGRATGTAYMKAAGMNGIPCAFLIDKTGTIAWIGHPMWLEMPLDAVVSGKWDLKTGPEQVANGQARLNEIYAKLGTAPREALTAWEGFEHDYPAVAHDQRGLKLNILLALDESDQADMLAAQLVDEALAAKDGEKLNEIAWTLVDPGSKVKKRNLDLALKAATAADGFAKHEDPSILDTLARVRFLQGDFDRAIELETKAVEHAKGSLKAALQKTLDQYTEAKAKKQ